MLHDIRVLTHSSIRISTDPGVLYVDPFKVEGEPHDADYILVTHDHFDHFSPEDIEKIYKSGTKLIVPANMEKKAHDVSELVDRIIPVHPGESYEIDGLSIETVPAYNRLKPFHPKSSGWVGYIVAADGERIYIAGDTDVTRENSAVKCDVALVPAGGTYTMNASEAAKLVNTIRPKTAIPTHYGSVVGSAGDAEAFRAAVDEGIEVRILMEN
ncbi:MAG: MBL fold metallo-hydrolase [Blautia sp.]|nr:MBL fold metallo-hydrolase [Blautia sp.]